MSEPNEAFTVDLAEVPNDVRALLQEAREAGKPVFFIRFGHFVGELRPISDEESAEMTTRALGQMAREIAVSQGPRGVGGK